MRIAEKPLAAEDEQVVAATRAWLERAVIGLNLCPFAKAVQLKNQIRYAVSAAQTPEDLLADFVAELRALQAADPSRYRDHAADASARARRFPGLQRFSGTGRCCASPARGWKAKSRSRASIRATNSPAPEPEDIENYSNRSPYPMLHLLREASIARAVAAFPDASRIFERNIETLRRLGHEGWRRLWADKA